MLIPLDNFSEPYETTPSSPEHDENSSSSWRSPIDKPSSPLQVKQVTQSIFSIYYKIFFFR